MPEPHSFGGREASEARGFLFDRLIVERGEDWTLSAPVAGARGDLSIRWTVQGAETLRDDGFSNLTLRGEGWSARAELIRRGQSIDTATGAPPLRGWRAASSPDGAVFWGGEGAPDVRLGSAALPCSWSEGACRVEASAGEVLGFDGGIVLAGAGPQVGRAEPLAESPSECEDPRFPAPLAGGTVGCSVPGTLDRFRPRPDGPRQQLGGADDLSFPSALAGVGLGAQTVLVVASDRLGTWRPRGGQLVPSPARLLALPPAADEAWVLLPLPDHVEVLAPGSSQRSLLPAHPRSDRGSATVGGGWGSWIDREGLAVARMRPLASGYLTANEPFGPLLSGDWLVFSDGERTRGAGLSSGRAWSVPLATGFAPERASLADGALLPVRDSHSLATAWVHVSSGVELARWGSATRWATPRGSDEAGVLLWVRAPGEPGELQRVPAPLRVYEDDGRLGWAGEERPGGHGGAHRVLAPGQESWATLGTVGSGSLRTFRPQTPGEGELAVVIGSIERRFASGEPGWLDLGPVPAGTRVRVGFLAGSGGEGLAIDALVLQEDRP